MPEIKIKKISEERFSILTLSKNPYTDLYSQELEWYADDEENVIATIILDLADNDYGFILLGRDERGLFRAIDVDVSFNTIEEVKPVLEHKIRVHAQKGPIYPQGDVKKRKNLIYKQIVPDNKLHPSYKALSGLEGYSPAKEIIQEIIYSFVDVDGNYVEQFQSAGFNSRVWELYLYALLQEEKFEIELLNAPDFEIKKLSFKGFLEAVTVNPSPGFDEKEPQNEEEAKILLRDYMPIKFGSPLFSKLQKKYWELPHVDEYPIIFAIADFHKEGSMIWSNSALSQYLYGYRYSHEMRNGKLTIIPEQIEKHTFKNKEIPSGFFFQPGAEHVSAVLFSNSGTIAKFNRMGKLAGFGSLRVNMTRVGLKYNFDQNATIPEAFTFEVEPGIYKESWGEGTTLFHNPNALRPINPDLFPGLGHHF